MNSILKNLLLLIAVLAAGLIVGHGAQRAVANYEQPSRAIETGDYSALIAQGDAPVVLFTTATCPWCNKAKAYLEARGIAYRNVDVTTPEGNQLFQQFGGNGVPLLMTSDLRLQGFMESEYDRHLQSLVQG